MSEVSELHEARRRINEILKKVVELDEELLGAIIVDEEGLPLTAYTRSEALDLDIGPSSEEALGGSIIDAYLKITELLGENRLNLGGLKRFILEGDKGVAILFPIKTINGLLLVYGTNKVKIGFIWTLLSELESKIASLASVAYGY